LPGVLALLLLHVNPIAVYLSISVFFTFLLQQTDFEMILPQLPHPQDMIKGKLVGAGFIRKK